MIIIIYSTIYSAQKVYDEEGTHGPTIQTAGTELTVTGAQNIPLRGDCWQISRPVSGYIPKSRVRQTTRDVPDPDPTPDPTPAPAPEGHVVRVTIEEEGYKPLILQGSQLPE